MICGSAQQFFLPPLVVTHAPFPSARSSSSSHRTYQRARGRPLPLLCHCRPRRRPRRRLSHHCHRQVSEASLGSHSDRRPMPPPSSFLPTSPLSSLHYFTLLLIDPYNFFCQQLSGKLQHVIHVDRCSSWLLCQCARSRRPGLSCGGGRAGGFLCMWHHPPRAASSKRGTIFDARTRLLLVCADLLFVCAHCPLLASWRAFASRPQGSAGARKKRENREWPADEVSDFTVV